MDSSINIKPVIKKKSYYQVLFLRDDQEVRTYRIRNGFLRFLVMSLTLLVVIGSAGAVFGAYSLHKGYKLKKKYKTTSAELDKVRLELEELQNVKSLIIATNTPLPLAHNSEVTNPTLNSTIAQEEEKSSNSTIPLVLPINNATNLDNIVHNASTSSNATMVEAPVIASISSEKSPVRVNGFKSRLRGTNLSVSYEISTSNPDASPEETVRGTTKYNLLLDNGQNYELEPLKQGEAYFAISRMKQMDLRFKIPGAVNTKKADRLRLTVELEDGDAFQDQFNLGK